MPIVDHDLPEKKTRLFEAIKVMAPVYAIDITTWGDKETVNISFTEAATNDQKLAAQEVIEKFDWSDTAQNAWKLQYDRKIASQQLLSNEERISRSILLVLVDELNSIRKNLGLDDLKFNDLLNSAKKKIEDGFADP